MKFCIFTSEVRERVWELRVVCCRTLEGDSWIEWDTMEEGEGVKVERFEAGRRLGEVRVMWWERSRLNSLTDSHVIVTTETVWFPYLVCYISVIGYYGVCLWLNRT